MPKQEETHRNVRGDSEVVAHATEILARRCCGESVTQIHADLVRRAAVKSCYATFARWVLEMEKNRLKVPLVPEYLKQRGILQGTPPARTQRPLRVHLSPQHDHTTAEPVIRVIRKVKG